MLGEEGTEGRFADANSGYADSNYAASSSVDSL